MTITPAIQSLLNRARELRTQLQEATNNADTYQGYADKYKAKVADLQASIADIERAIDALSYPGEQSE